MKEMIFMITFKEIQKIIKDFEKSTLTELELSFEEVSIKLSKNTYEQKSITQTTTETEPKKITDDVDDTSQDTPIKSPLVGTFYRSESPDAKPFVEVGSMVKKGDVLCIIEAMKIMNEIVAPVSGKITKILVNDKEVANFDQVLMTIGQADEA